MTNLETLDRTHFVRFDNERDAKQFFAANPHTRLVAECIGQRTDAGQILAVVEYHASPEEAQAARQAATHRDRLAKLEYNRLAAKRSQNKKLL